VKKTTKKIVLSLILIFASTVTGAVIPALTLDRGGWGGYSLCWSDRTHGWKFTVNEDIEVVELGIFDLEDDPMYAPGLLYSHEIGMWHSGELIYSTTIPSGTENTVLIDQFRYVEIPPILLTAGERYVIGSTIVGDPHVGNSSTDIVTLLPPITYKKTLISQSGSGFSLPTEPRDYYSCGPNFLYVPKSADTYYVSTTGDDENDGLGELTSFATIRKAIEVAHHGDDIIVADGTYTGVGNCYINFKGKAIALRSKNGPTNCIIDCQGSEDKPSRAFRFQNNETAGSLLKGFTITGGYARTGGGIKCDDARPIIENCVFSGNSAEDHGGGMSNTNSSPTVKDCVFAGNSSGFVGGGMASHFFSKPIVTGCKFIGNSAIEGGGWSGKGTLINCTFIGNSARDGGGMYGRFTLMNCSFINNRATSKGGGIYNAGSYNSLNSSQLYNCLFNANHAGVSGGGVFNGGHLQLVNCIFSANSADWNGGGIFNDGYLSLFNCTFSANFARIFGGGIHNKSDGLKVVNCILWENEDSTGRDEAAQISGTLPPYMEPGPHGEPAWPVANSCIQGWTRGGTNINGNPLFVDADGADNIHGTDDDNLHLLPWSPCIDSGNNMLAWYMFVGDVNDLDGRPRIVDGDNDGIAVIDMGAYESLAPLEAAVNIVPKVIIRNNFLKRIITILHLPEGIGRHDVVDERLKIYVDGIDVGPIEVNWQRVIGWRRKVKVFALFDKSELIDAVPNNGRVELTVVGSLESGRYIYGTDTVRIVQRQMRLRCRRRH